MTISLSTPVATTFHELTTRFGAVCDRLAEVDWQAPSPCEAWTARDVLRHVVDTERDFLSRHEVELADVDLTTAPAAGWHRHAERLLEAVGDRSLTDRAFDGYFGPTTVGDTLVRFYGFDLVVHRWDLAATAGLEERFDEEELDLLETCIAGYGDALYAEGVCRTGVKAAAGSDRQARVLATLGRRA